MTILTGIAAHHNASPGLVALVSNRAYPVTAPQNPVYPYYTFQRVSTPNRAGSHRGDSLLEQSRFQFTVNATTALNADAVAEQIKADFLGFAGMMADVYVSGITLANDLDGYDPVTQKYQRAIDLMMWHRPSL